MLAAPVLDMVPSPRRRAWVPLVLSAVLHLLLALVWMGFPVPEHHAEEPTIQVELTTEPPPPAPAPQGEAGHKAAASKATEQGIPVPQLEEGILAQRSSRPLVKEPDSAPAAPQARPEPKPEPKPKKPPPVTQNERDFVLGQVMRHWVQPKELGNRDKANVRLAVTIGADGYFRDIYDSRRPWNPVEVFDGYNALPPNSLERRTIDALLRAIRQAQPVRLPPALREKTPFEVRLDFRFKDVR